MELPGYAGGAWVLVARAAELLALLVGRARCGGCSKVAADLGPWTRLGVPVEACDSAGAAYEALLSASVNEVLGLAYRTLLALIAHCSTTGEWTDPQICFRSTILPADCNAAGKTARRGPPALLAALCSTGLEAAGGERTRAPRPKTDSHS